MMPLEERRYITITSGNTLQKNKSVVCHIHLMGLPWSD